MDLYIYAAVCLPGKNVCRYMYICIYRWMNIGTTICNDPVYGTLSLGELKEAGKLETEQKNVTVTVM